ncbi:MAG: UPF0175 family protein [Chloroflexota bacterium]
MTTIHIDFPEDIQQILKRNDSELADDLRLYGAMMLFGQGKLSSGMAARMAGISRVEFLLRCGEFNIPVIQQEPSDLEEELSSAFSHHL